MLGVLKDRSDGRKGSRLLDAAQPCQAGVDADESKLKKRDGGRERRRLSPVTSSPPSVVTPAQLLIISALLELSICHTPPISPSFSLSL